MLEDGNLNKTIEFERAMNSRNKFENRMISFKADQVLVKTERKKQSVQKCTRIKSTYNAHKAV